MQRCLVDLLLTKHSDVRFTAVNFCFSKGSAVATKKRGMQRVHTVRAELVIPQLTKAGSSLELEIFAEGQKLGTLVLGRGSIEWAGGKRKSSKRISWSRFAEMMDELAYGSL